MRSFTWLTMLSLLALPSTQVFAQGFDIQTVASAAPDECYNGFGQPYVPYVSAEDCNGEGTPKRNHTYPWGMATVGHRVWIGTGANIFLIGKGTLGSTEPLDTSVVVAEYEASQYPGISDNARSVLGDWRPPQLWVYDTITEQQTNITPADPLLNSTLGLRSVGTNDGIVIVGGPGLNGLGINLFAFDANTLEFLGSKSLWQYSSVRKWLVINGVMYTGVQDTLTGDGSVLRWNGNRRNPFRIETVGILDNDVANLAYHNGRLYAGTWSPGTLSSLASLIKLASGNAQPCGIWMSPPIPSTGLHFWHLGHWSKVWDVTEYESDPVIARAYGIGEMISYDGALYWGTMNPPGTGYFALESFYGGLQNDELAFFQSNRRTSLFRAADFADSGSTNPVELLYGESTLPVYHPPTENSDEVWENVPTGFTPTFGSSGFGSFFNYYTWSLGILNNKLFVGTYKLEFQTREGADLWVFPDSSSPAQRAGTKGLGNRFNEGFRNIVSTPDALYVGATNGFNLLPNGGWQLIRVREVTP